VQFVFLFWFELVGLGAVRIAGPPFFFGRSLPPRLRHAGAGADAS
jgi:hypothetical protein